MVINLSIIIPHKNSPELLRRCLNSILDIESIQVIVVDDNSDANKVKFEHFPGLEREYTSVFLTKEGLGAGYARNVGLQHATGEWLLFADADDFFNEGFLDCITPFFNTNNDLVYFSASSVDSATGKPSKRNRHLEDIIHKYRADKLSSREDLIYINWAPWSKLFRHGFVIANDLKFEEVKVGNDARFVIQAGELARNIAVSKSQIYCVTYNSKSLTYRVPDESFFDERFAAKLRINDYLHNQKKNKYKLGLGSDILLSKKYGIRKLKQTIYLAKKHNNNICISLIKAVVKNFLGKSLY
ncbi:glycosyltransferase family 2 protein [Leeuwenhoekiella sp. W20_SRS_FM14]|uniref:glycosyltransferase family 2 protein n=1 Tax=Leeuwenhoekiella sp. W20_SRS_FM14 TaxID=3240270 RepID=UPI003F98B261